jgi:hypothetical protein
MPGTDHDKKDVHRKENSSPTLEQKKAGGALTVPPMLIPPVGKASQRLRIILSVSRPGQPPM